MKRETIIKIILTIFFIVFFGFIFWYFYTPEENQKTNQEENDFFSNIFPSNGNISENNFSEDNENNFSEDNEIQIPKLRQLSKNPTSSIYFWQKKENKEFNIRFLEITTGHVFQTETDNTNITRVSNTTIPRIKESFWVSEDEFFIRYLNSFGDIKTFYSVLKNKIPQSPLSNKENVNNNSKDDYKKTEGIFFPDNIKEIVFNKNEKEIFYLLENNEDENSNKTKGYITNINSTERTEIFNSELKYWNMNSFFDENILFSQKSSYKNYTPLFNLNKNTGVFEKIFEAKKSLNHLASKDFSKILITYKEDFGNNFVFGILDLETNNFLEIDSFPTIIEKCVWSDLGNIFCAGPRGGFSEKDPDSWYKGFSIFEDFIYKINPENRNVEIIFNSQNEEYRSFDIINLGISADEKYLYFINKKTFTPWVYKI